MKKMIIALIVLAFFAVGSLTAFFIVKSGHDKEAKEAARLAAEYSFFSFDSEAIKKITIDTEGKQYVANRDMNETGSIWHLENTEEFDANSTYFQNIVTYLYELNAVTDYGIANDSQKAEYGLDDPVKIVASDGSNDYTIYIGNPSPTNEYFYVMVEDRPKVYAIEASYGSILKATRSMIKNKDLVPFDDDEVAKVQVIREGKTVLDLQRNFETYSWNLPGGYSHLTIDNSAITTFVGLITRTEVQIFFEENLEDLSKYGFDKPYAELVVTSKDGTTFKRLFSYMEGDNNYVYVLFEETGQAAAFYAADNPYVQYSPVDVIATNLCSYSLYDIDSLEIGYDGSTDLFEIDHDSNTVKMNGTPLESYGSTCNNAFSEMYSEIQYLKISDVNIDIEPEYTDPLLSCKYAFSDGTSLLMELVKYGDSDLCVFMDGMYTGQILSVDSVVGKNNFSDLRSRFYELIK